MGTPLSRKISRSLEITAPLYVDSTGDAYTHAGFRRNFGLTLRTVSRLEHLLNGFAKQAARGRLAAGRTPRHCPGRVYPQPPSR